MYVMPFTVLFTAYMVWEVSGKPINLGDLQIISGFFSDFIWHQRCANSMDIYNKIMKNELNLSIMASLLDVLQAIENGQVGQHEGSARL